MVNFLKRKSSRQPLRRLENGRMFVVGEPGVGGCTKIKVMPGLLNRAHILDGGDRGSIEGG